MYELCLCAPWTCNYSLGGKVGAARNRENDLLVIAEGADNIKDVPARGENTPHPSLLRCFSYVMSYFFFFFL